VRSPEQAESETFNPIRRDFYLDTLRNEYTRLTPRQRRRLWRRYPILEIALRHLVDDKLI
jgi:hypothetical protein